MKKIILAPIVGAFFLTCTIAEERSAFGAGDLTSSNPYGLTDTEKVLLKNKEKVTNLKRSVGTVSTQVGTLEEQMDGVRSVLDGTNERMNKIDRRVSALEASFGKDSNSGDISTQLEELHVYLNESRKSQDKNNKKIKRVLQELSSLIDSINSNYVSKKAYSDLERRLAKLEGKKSVAISTKQVSKKSGKELLAGAQKFFNEGKYDKAKDYFTQSISKQYKPALSNFMLGEISYKQKSYSNAITYYKNSVQLYDKASYMPKLLYHTAISFDKIGDRANANKFYAVLKSNYPDTKEAKASPNRE